MRTWQGGVEEEEHGKEVLRKRRKEIKHILYNQKGGRWA